MSEGFLDLISGREDIQPSPPPDPSIAEQTLREESRKKRRSAQAAASRLSTFGPTQLQVPGLRRPRS